MKLNINTQDGERYVMLVPDERFLADFTRNIVGAKERHVFIHLQKQWLENKSIGDVYINPDFIVSYSIDKSGPVIESAPDTSHLNAVTKEVSPEELRAAQLVKQPMLEVFEKAQAAEEKANEKAKQKVR